MKVEKKQKGGSEAEKKAARKRIAGGAMKVEKKQEGATEVVRKGISGGAMKVEKKQEVVKKAARKGVAGGPLKMEKKQEGAMESEKKVPTKGMPASGSSSGGETVPAVKSQNLAECDKAEVEKGKGVKGMRLVSQKHIDMLLKEKATGTGAYRVLRSIEFTEKYKGSLDFRSLVARTNACMEKVRAEDAKILDQYELHGCAYTNAKEAFVIDEEIQEKIRRYLPRWQRATA